MPRRRFASLFACLIGLATPLLAAPGPAGAQSAPPTITPPGFTLAGGDPSTAAPLRVWLLGDSVMHDAAPALSAALGATGEATVVADSTFGGWGLTTQSAWEADSNQIIEDYRPQVVVGTWSWDDTMAGAHPRRYAALLTRALGDWLAPGNGVRLVALVQFPPVGPNPFVPGAIPRLDHWIEVTAEQEAWDRIARSMTSVFPGRVVYLSTAQVFAPGGRFVTWAHTAGGWTRVRQVDNTHLCAFGAVEFGRSVVDELRSVLGLPAPTPGWQSGPWTADQRYQAGPFGPGACPANQPPMRTYTGVRVPTPGGRS